MNNKELLRPFDLAQAEAGAAICWSYLDQPVTFVGRTIGESIAIRREDDVIETPHRTSLRMKPLFWKEGKPVYVGDNLWHTLSKRTLVVNRLQENADAEKYGLFYDAQGTRARADLCIFEEPPQPLFMLEGKPVFKGDRLWHNHDSHWVTVTGMFPSGDFIDENGISRSPCYCTWEKPKTTVVRYANVYTDLLNGKAYYLGEMYSTPDGPKGVCGSEKSLGIARIEWQE